MTLLDYNTLMSVYNKKSQYPNIIPKTYSLWSSTEQTGYRNGNYYGYFRALDINFADGSTIDYADGVGELPGRNKGENLYFMCVKSK